MHYIGIVRDIELVRGNIFNYANDIVLTNEGEFVYINAEESTKYFTTCVYRREYFSNSTVADGEVVYKIGC